MNFNKNTMIRVVLDSLINDVRVTTFEITMPRIILPQFSRHRVFSLNVCSNRAMSAKRVRELTSFSPSLWRKNGKGMSPYENLGKFKSFLAGSSWEVFKLLAKSESFFLALLGVHKEQTNRVLEPFQYCKLLVTSTEWENFLRQRLDNHAQFEIREVAKLIQLQLKLSAPVDRQFHLPYITEKEWATIKKDAERGSEELLTQAIISSVARCARVSYYNFDGQASTFAKDRETFSKLILANPPHLSPAEHQVMDPFAMFASYTFNESGEVDENANFGGNLGPLVAQFRKTLEIPGILTAFTEIVKKA